VSPIPDFIKEALKKSLFDLLLKYSNGGEISYFFAVSLARQRLGIDGKLFRRLMLELHADGFWEWNGWKIKLLLPTKI